MKYFLGLISFSMRRHIRRILRLCTFISSSRLVWISISAICYSLTSQVKGQFATVILFSKCKLLLFIDCQRFWGNFCLQLYSFRLTLFACNCSKNDVPSTKSVNIIEKVRYEQEVVCMGVCACVCVCVCVRVYKCVCFFIIVCKWIRQGLMHSLIFFVQWDISAINPRIIRLIWKHLVFTTK